MKVKRVTVETGDVNGQPDLMVVDFVLGSVTITRRTPGLADGCEHLTIAEARFVNQIIHAVSVVCE